MQNCVGEVLLLGIFAVAAYRDWKEQMICVYVLLLAAWVSREEIGYGDGAMLMASGIFLGFWRNVELFLTALMLIVPTALFGLIVKHRRKDYRMPFLPFLFVAYVFQLGWR